MYIRKTKDVYFMLSNYGYGWEEELECDDWKDAKAQVKCYRENCPSASFKVVKRRIRIGEEM